MSSRCKHTTATWRTGARQRLPGLPHLGVHTAAGGPAEEAADMGAEALHARHPGQVEAAPGLCVRSQGRHG